MSEATLLIQAAEEALTDKLDAETLRLVLQAFKKCKQELEIYDNLCASLKDLGFRVEHETHYVQGRTTQTSRLFLNDDLVCKVIGASVESNSIKQIGKSLFYAHYGLKHP